MTPSQKKEIEKVFDEKFLDKNAASGVNTREYPNLPKLIQKIKSFLFSVLDQALAEQREEMREKIEGMIEKEKSLKAADDMEKTAEWYKIQALFEVLSFLIPPNKIKIK